MDRSDAFARLCALACEATDASDLEQLFSKVRDINDTDEGGHPPLWYAATENPNLSVLRSLLDAKATVDVDMVEQAVMYNANPAIARLLYAHVAPVGDEELDELFLLAAASNVHDELVRFFLHEGANPDATMPMDLYPSDREEGMESSEPDDIWWDAQQSVRQNALVVAMYENPEPVSMVESLLALKVNPNAIDSEGFPVLVHALDDARLVRVLVEGGADIDLTDESGMTALMHACAADNNEVVMTLLGMGADVRLLSHTHEGALHYALGCHLLENTEVIHALIKAGCDVNQPDGDGLLPLDIARFNYCSQEVIDLLERSGARMGDDLS
ncbi:MAG: ankyrin repeat domain-containing protein [Sphaerochaetaceae bacterium]|nr:ankyrin repeat domain-containing protein [Sphaerochaetaceae bacterium]MDD3941491.1 ankyrin repeat domain-containing protein [Sphaerochaetaceae bacterium]